MEIILGIVGLLFFASVLALVGYALIACLIAFLLD